MKGGNLRKLEAITDMINTKEKFKRKQALKKMKTFGEELGK